MKRTLVGALAVLLALAFAGCQSGNDSNNGVASAGGAKSASPNAAAAPSGDQDELAQQFQRCMKEQGVEVQMATGGGGSTTMEVGPGASGDPAGSQSDPKKVEAAMEKCKQYAPNGGTPPKADPAQAEALLKFARCMRDNGVANFPDPDPNGGVKVNATMGFDPNSDAFKAAQQKCQLLLPARGVTPASGSGG